MMPGDENHEHEEFCRVLSFCFYKGGHAYMYRVRNCQISRVPWALGQWAENEELDYNFKDAFDSLTGMNYYVHLGPDYSDVEEEA